MIRGTSPFHNAPNGFRTGPNDTSDRNRVQHFSPSKQDLRRSRLRTICVPLDGSQFAEHAIPHALAIARRSGATLRIVHIHSVLDLLTDPWRHSYADSYYEGLYRKAQAYLSDVAQRIRRASSVDVVAILDRSNDIVDGVCRVAGTTDFVVLATHGRGVCGRFWKGNVATTLMNRLNCPMLFVRGYDSPVHFSADPIAQHILVPLDGSRSSELVLRPAAAIGRLTRSRLTLVKVRDHALSTILDHEADRDAMDYLSTTARRVKRDFGAISTQILDGQYGIARRIVDAAKENDVDVIALANHPRNTLQRMFHRSVVDTVLHRSATPVLIYGSASVATT